MRTSGSHSLGTARCARSVCLVGSRLVGVTLHHYANSLLVISVYRAIRHFPQPLKRADKVHCPIHSLHAANNAFDCDARTRVIGQIDLPVQTYISLAPFCLAVKASAVLIWMPLVPMEIEMDIKSD